MTRQDAPGPGRSAALAPQQVGAALVDLLEPVVRGTGVDLEDVTVTPAGRRRLVRVVVDADGGVDLDRVADVSRAVSAVLDEPDADAVLGGAPYVLEVTSPGTDRPLRDPRHWRRARGRLVVVRRPDGSQLRGRVLEAGDEAATLDDGTQAVEVRYADVARAVVEVEFRRPDGDEEEEGEQWTST